MGAILKKTEINHTIISLALDASIRLDEPLVISAFRKIVSPGT